MLRTTKVHCLQAATISHLRSSLIKWGTKNADAWLLARQRPNQVFRNTWKLIRRCHSVIPFFFSKDFPYLCGGMARHNQLADRGLYGLVILFEDGCLRLKHSLPGRLFEERMSRIPVPTHNSCPGRTGGGQCSQCNYSSKSAPGWRTGRWPSAQEEVAQALCRQGK